MVCVECCRSRNIIQDITATCADPPYQQIRYPYSLRVLGYDEGRRVPSSSVVCPRRRYRLDSFVIICMSRESEVGALFRREVMVACDGPENTTMVERGIGADT